MSTIIRDPGKFEGEPIYVPYLWAFVLQGDGESIYDGTVDDPGTQYTCLGIDPDDILAFPELAGV